LQRSGLDSNHLAPSPVLGEGVQTFKDQNREVQMYKPGGTIRETLKDIQNNRYVLPAIQREFVWQPPQIAQLFDSLMQDYPIGTFLFWNVESTNSDKFKFYGFVRDYHQKNNPHCPDLGVITNQNLIAVLDGQQRLTALNIGLRGSMALKLPRKYWSNPDAFPEQFLYLDLLAESDVEHEEFRYRFKFLNPKKAVDSDTEIWFKVPDILAIDDPYEVFSWITEKHPGLDAEKVKKANKTLSLLHKKITEQGLINYYEEKSQDIEKVLNIFIRMNSGGTVLSYSDLLLSIAVAQWSELDARQEIYKLIDELNNIRNGFNFSKDFVLKAGLMLADISSVGFKVNNFNHENMAKLESLWSKIRQSLTLTVQLVADFGLNGSTLRADSSILPIAYYIYQKGYTDHYSKHCLDAEERKQIKHWLFRSLLKSSGIWGSGLDTLLTALRTAIKDSQENGFPLESLTQTMRQRGKSLTFEDEEIEELATLKYGDKRVFLLLSLLYPFVDLRNQFHIDHIFPKSKFTLPKLKNNQGLNDEQVEQWQILCNQLPNLQLLDGQENIEKQAILPMTWLENKHRTEEGDLDVASIKHYCSQHDLGTIPVELKDFRQFYEARYQALKTKITNLINVT
jgi:hypothetical protein